MKISYKKFIEDLPLQGKSTIAPELDKDCLYRYIELCKKYKVDHVLNREIFYIGDGFALTKCWYNSTLEIPIYHQTCHPFIPWTFEQLSDLAPAILKLSSKMQLPFAPESLTFFGKRPSGEFVAKLNSRRTRLHCDYDCTLASLNTKRRYKIKQANSQLISLGYTRCTANESMLPDISKILKQKYPDKIDYEYALVQSIWAIAAEAVCLYLNNESAYAFFIERNIGLQTANPSEVEMMFQAMVQNDNNNAGAQLLTAAIHEFSLSSAYIEPTCKTCFEDKSIDVYKRLITNEDNLVDMVMIATEEMCQGYMPPFYTEKGWVK